MRLQGALFALVTVCRTAWLRLLNRSARRYYEPRFRACGPNLQYHPLTSEIDYANTAIGANVYIGPGAVIGRARIGDDVMMGPNVHLRDGNHRFDVVGQAIRESGDGPPGEVEVGDDVWLGEGTVALPGSRIGEGSVIGTKSMVTGTIPPYVLAVGQPCRPVKKRFSDDELREHVRLRGRSPEHAEALIAERARSLTDPIPTAAS